MWTDRKDMTLDVELSINPKQTNKHLILDNGRHSQITYLLEYNIFIYFRCWLLRQYTTRRSLFTPDGYEKSLKL